MKLSAILSLWIFLIACGWAAEDVAAVLPQKVSELQKRIQHKSLQEAHEITLGFLGKPDREVGSGISLEQWDIEGGILSFHHAGGPTFCDAAGRLTKLVPARNEVATNIESGFEMYSLAEQDPHKNGNIYWLGNIDLNASGQYEYLDSGQELEYKKLFPPHFFVAHPKGEFRVSYSGEVKPNDVLENIPDDTEICRITFVSGGKSEVFGIVTSRSWCQLRFESDGQVFSMYRGWNEDWPKETTK